MASAEERLATLEAQIKEMRSDIGKLERMLDRHIQIQCQSRLTWPKILAGLASVVVFLGGIGSFILFAAHMVSESLRR